MSGYEWAIFACNVVQAFGAVAFVYFTIRALDYLTREDV